MPRPPAGTNWFPDRPPPSPAFDGRTDPETGRPLRPDTGEIAGTLDDYEIIQLPCPMGVGTRPAARLVTAASRVIRPPDVLLNHALNGFAGAGPPVSDRPSRRRQIRQAVERIAAGQGFAYAGDLGEATVYLTRLAALAAGRYAARADQWPADAPEPAPTGAATQNRTASIYGVAGVKWLLGWLPGWLAAAGPSEEDQLRGETSTRVAAPWPAVRAAPSEGVFWRRELPPQPGESPPTAWAEAGLSGPEAAGSELAQEIVLVYAHADGVSIL